MTEIHPVHRRDGADARGRRRRYDGELNEHWTIGPKVHGGAMLALCANAARRGAGGRTQRPGTVGETGVEPIAVSGNFLWAPDPGPMRVVDDGAQARPPGQPDRRRADDQGDRARRVCARR